jgi:hypothetical protein
MCDRLRTATAQVLAKDAFDDRGLCRIDNRRGEATAEAITMSLELVPVASAAGDATRTDATAKRFARARANRFELHLMAGALDKRGRLIDRVGERDLLSARVIEQAATAIADQVTDDERDLDCIATEARLIATDDDVTALRFCDQSAQTRAREEVIARASIVDVVDVQLAGETHASDVLFAALRLDIEAELLLAFVVLGTTAVGSNRHHSSPCARR